MVVLAKAQTRKRVGTIVVVGLLGLVMATAGVAQVVEAHLRVDGMT